jgi:hypothetical protein
MTSAAADPFRERERAAFRARLDILGAAFTVESTSAAALQLAIDAFGGLPRHKLTAMPRHFRVRFVDSEHSATWPRGAEPPRPTLSADEDLLCATVDAGNFAVIDIRQARALVSMSRAMLRRPYHARYELIELAMLTLAARGQSLVPLHAACVGSRGAGALLMGGSGAGKSTVALHALAAGMELLAEDSAFVCPDTLLITGTPSFLHVNESATLFLPTCPLLAQIRRSKKITRRSGARKYELDLRRSPAKLAAKPLQLSTIVFLSRRRAARGDALAALGYRALLERLRREQPYAAGLPGWRTFERRIAAVPAYELRRTRHPDDSVQQLLALLADSKHDA